MAIERVLHPPIAPARRFRGLVDTVFTLALGSVCAFALTLGPAPLNTVASSSPAAASFDDLGIGPAAIPLLPSEVGNDSSADHEREAAQQRADTTAPPTAPPTTAPPVATPATDAVSQSPSAAGRAAPPAAPANPAAGVVPDMTAAAALTIVESYRTASGLTSFVSAGTCATPTLHTTVAVTPPGALPLGLAKTTLAPHPAYATADAGEIGVVKVTIYSCQ